MTQNVYQDYDPDNPNVEWAEFWGQKPPGSEDSESSVKPGWMVEIEKLQNSGNAPAKDVTQNVPALDDTNVSGMQTLGMSPARSESVQTPTAQASSGLGKRPFVFHDTSHPTPNPTLHPLFHKRTRYLRPKQLSAKSCTVRPYARFCSATQLLPSFLHVSPVVVMKLSLAV